MLRFLSVVVLAACCVTAGAEERPPVTGQVTFLYFEDVDGAETFYGSVLGLKKTFDQGWVKIFQVSPSASVGLVNATRGVHRPSPTKPVMVSMVVDETEVDAWWSYLKSRGVDMGDEGPKVHAEVGIRAFAFEDPEGHTLEVFAWIQE